MFSVLERPPASKFQLSSTDFLVDNSHMGADSPSGEMQSVYDRCRKRFPTIDLPIEDFLNRAGQSGVEFPLLHHEDLFLATACAGGNRIAWEYFADDFLPLLERAAAQACRRFGESEDIAHEILAVLIENPNRLGRYDGRGSLASWLRVAVARAAIDRFRRARREVPLEIEPGLNQEPGAVREPAARAESIDPRWETILAEVLKDELKRLPARDRLLLGLYYMHGVPLKLIGRQFGVHEATASRWLDRVRSGIRKRVEAELRRRHRLRPGEIASIWRALAEEGKLSLKEIL